MERFQDAKFGSSKRDISRLIKTPEEYANFLLESFNTWDEKTRTLYKHTILITIDDIAPQKVSPKLDEIVDDLGVLIEIFVC